MRFSGDLADAEILMASTFFFKGAWKMPFNKSATVESPFYDENGNSIGKVRMMHHLAPFPYAIVQELKAHAVELPYGEVNDLSLRQ